jgi:hypothetical protein
MNLFKLAIPLLLTVTFASAAAAPEPEAGSTQLEATPKPKSTTKRMSAKKKAAMAAEKKKQAVGKWLAAKATYNALLDDLFDVVNGGDDPEKLAQLLEAAKIKGHGSFVCCPRMHRLLKRAIQDKHYYSSFKVIFDAIQFEEKDRDEYGTSYFVDALYSQNHDIIDFMATRDFKPHHHVFYMGGFGNLFWKAPFFRWFIERHPKHAAGFTPTGNDFHMVSNLDEAHEMIKMALYCDQLSVGVGNPRKFDPSDFLLNGLPKASHLGEDDAATMATVLFQMGAKMTDEDFEKLNKSYIWKKGKFYQTILAWAQAHNLSGLDAIPKVAGKDGSYRFNFCDENRLKSVAKEGDNLDELIDLDENCKLEFSSEIEAVLNDVIELHRSKSFHFVISRLKFHSYVYRDWNLNKLLVKVLKTHNIDMADSILTSQMFSLDESTFSHTIKSTWTMEEIKQFRSRHKLFYCGF